MTFRREWLTAASTDECIAVPILWEGGVRAIWVEHSEIPVFECWALPGASLCLVKNWAAWCDPGGPSCWSRLLGHLIGEVVEPGVQFELQVGEGS